MNKYKNKKEKVNGIKFDSKIEAEFYEHLLEINKNSSEDLEIKLQETFELQPKFVKNGKSYRAINYKADFSIYNKGELVRVIDVKGLVLPLAKVKKKMFEFRYDIELNFVCKCPDKYRMFGESGWIESDFLEKLRRDSKKAK